MPTDKNESEGNLFMKMPSGFLRILYPAPTECLDLKTWREFHGFDLTGAEADFDIDIDTDHYILEIRPSSTQARRPFGRRWGELIQNPADLPKVKADAKATIDFFGNEMADEDRIAGPFTALAEGMVINIDPRKLK